MSDETNTAAPASPFAQPASPFAAPAITAEAPAATSALPQGDTSFLDNTTSREPLIKGCTVPGVISAIAAKESSGGNPFLSVSVQLFGEGMVYEDGTPVSAGKRLATNLFASSKDQDGLQRTGRQLKGALLALHNVPLDGKEDLVYKGWPVEQRIALLPGNRFSLAPFEPGDKWAGTKVMVQVKKGKDMDGNPRNEFTLLAASTKPVERKGRS